MKGKFESVGRLLSVVLLITGIMGMAGCGRHSDADESHLLGKRQSQETDMSCVLWSTPKQMGKR